jgi:hypothetical protein
MLSTYVINNLLDDVSRSITGDVLVYYKNGQLHQISYRDGQLLRDGELVTCMPLVPPGCVFGGELTRYFEIKSYIVPKKLSIIGSVEAVVYDRIYFSSYSDSLTTATLRFVGTTFPVTVRCEKYAVRDPAQIYFDEKGTIIVGRHMPSIYRVEISVKEEYKYDVTFSLGDFIIWKVDWMKGVIYKRYAILTSVALPKSLMFIMNGGKIKKRFIHKYINIGAYPVTDDT